MGEKTQYLLFHPNAAKNFDELGESLLTKVSAQPIQVPPPQTWDFPDIPVRATFSTAVIQNLERTEIAPAGHTTARYFDHKDNHVGFWDADYTEFARLCEKVHGTKSVGQYISGSAIEDTVFEWMKSRYFGSTKASLSEYVLERCEALISDFEIWIPLALTYLPYDIGFTSAVTARTLTKGFFDQQRTALLEREGTDSKKIEAQFDEYERELQGLASVVVEIKAEPKRAYEVALEDAETVAAIFRFFSPAIFIPNKSTCCAPLGDKEPRYERYFVLKGDTLYSSVHGSHDLELGPWRITPGMLEMWQQVGLGNLIELLFKGSRSDFEESVASSLIKYTKGALARTPGDKLMYVCSALESLLLKDQSEPIQQNVADRIAYTICGPAKDRLQVVENFKAAYKMRSQFVHHSQSVEESDTLTTFLFNVWRFYGNVIHRYLHLETRADFLSELDTLKYS